jgi:hypothetical protein
LGTLAVDAKDPLRAIILLVMSKDRDPRGIESGRDHLALSGFQSFPVEGELNSFSR